MTYREFWQPLTARYDEGEAKAIARLVAEVRYGLTLADVLAGRLETVDEHQLSQLQQRLLAGEPVQYVLGEAQFLGRWFHVEPGVLIPRPETEELCHWIVSQGDSSLMNATNILDIGTGSGCIAITLAAEMRKAKVTAWDISENALEVARENARRLNVNVTFEQVDVIHIPSNSYQQTSKVFDVIVSNPPYIINKERSSMEANVLNYEPPTALFVPDDDPLLFYRAIAAYGQNALRQGGWLYFEINPLYAQNMIELLSSMSYHDIETRYDEYGKQRMIRAQK